jgi:ATP phosphoribosyltransferase regulatory subunit HisZ
MDYIFQKVQLRGQGTHLKHRRDTYSAAVFLTQRDLLGSLENTQAGADIWEVDWKNS